MKARHKFSYLAIGLVSLHNVLLVSNPKNNSNIIKKNKTKNKTNTINNFHQLNNSNLKNNTCASHNLIFDVFYNSIKNMILFAKKCRHIFSHTYLKSTRGVVLKAFQAIRAASIVFSFFAIKQFSKFHLSKQFADLRKLTVSESQISKLKVIT